MKYDNARVDPATVRRMELVRAVLGHGGLLSPEEIERCCSVREHDEELDRIDEEGYLGEWAGGPWQLAAERYVALIARKSAEDERAHPSNPHAGFSFPRLYLLPVDGGSDPVPALIHRTCTNRTVILATESLITGWSYTRAEVAGVRLCFGSPPEWLRLLFEIRVAETQRRAVRFETMTERLLGQGFIQRDNDEQAEAAGAVGVEIGTTYTGFHEWVFPSDLEEWARSRCFNAVDYSSVGNPRPVDSDEAIKGKGGKIRFFPGAVCPRCGDWLVSEHINCPPEGAEERVAARLLRASQQAGVSEA